MKSNRFVAIISTCATLAVLIKATPVQACFVCDDDGGPTICVEFDNLPYPPLENWDFRFDFSDPNNPSVDLLQGDDGQGTPYYWRIWSIIPGEDPTPANIGSITAYEDFDYHVKILQPDNDPGADNVALVDLRPGDGTKYSNLTAGAIDGDLTGDLYVQKSSSTGEGGVASLTIDGSIEGNISIPVLSNLTISGAVGSDATITIGDIDSTGDVLNFNENTGEFAGILTLKNGLPQSGQIVEINGLFTGLIDFEGNDVIGDLEIHKGGSGNIIDGGEVVNLVLLGGGGNHPPPDDPFSGEATFASISATGEIQACPGNLSCRINILGDMRGVIGATGMEDISGNLTDVAQVIVGGDLPSGGFSFQRDIAGEISIAGKVHTGAEIFASRHIAGAVTIMGDVDGDILSGSGEITGPVTVGGVFDGNICGDNLEPDECLPDNIDIGSFGPDWTVCGEGAPACQCGLDPPEQPEGEEGYAKNRYLSLVPGNTGVLTALRVKFVDMPEQFESWEGETVWVGEPEEICENSGQRDPPPWGCGPAYPTLTLMVAECVCEPYYADWPTIVGNDVDLHVYGQEIVPGGTYEIEAIHEGCYVGIESNYSEPPLAITTSRWGDICGVYNNEDPENPYWTAPDGEINTTLDVTACLEKFTNKVGAPIKARCDVDPETPQQKVNISTDVMRILDAFRGQPYPFPMPTPCP